MISVFVIILVLVLVLLIKISLAGGPVDVIKCDKFWEKLIKCFRRGKSCRSSHESDVAVTTVLQWVGGDDK